ncbi:6-phosphofructokinase [Lachnobacterium bovis]|uniref:Pyrophosphate--fructose 6-phosphate 1-phosphotransferase n=1 Tax=Lachnobacterium bovis DSM 14045 TaxID=1122142 RepID=A0A1H3J397_9FIRM|nr:6-phosphofructokinase [Lachnobacterium bovis]SDY34075.1 6-phosphofructokinase 1 [Lachnobacterium bovis DSM 14045]
MTQNNVLVAQSGGPTVAINSSLAGVIAATVESKKYDICYGALNGVTGILDERYLNLSQIVEQDSTIIDQIKSTPAMYLGSCRHKLPNFDDDSHPYEQIFSQFEKLQISAFFYIGGNDSMDTVLKLSDYAKKINSNIRIIGIPKTIDNDLCMTDHTPGFGSAAKYVATSILEISHDTYIYKVKSVTIVEIMGRDAGWLTASSALARNKYSMAPHLIYLPEVAFDKEQFIEDVKKQLKTTNNVIVAVSEGIRDKDGNYISAGETAEDTFGHAQLSGAGKTLEYLVKEQIGVKVRSVEINVLQRCASHIASKTDLDEAFVQGKKAVEFASNGVTAAMVVIKRLSNDPYTVEYDYAVIKNIANEAKSVPVEWINKEGNNITKELFNYLLPLIQGEVSIKYSNGLPTYMDVSHLHKRSEK